MVDIISVALEESLVVNYRGKIVRLRVFNIRNGQVKFGVEADEGVLVNREEIYEIMVAKRRAKLFSQCNE